MPVSDAELWALAKGRSKKAQELQKQLSLVRACRNFSAVPLKTFLGVILSLISKIEKECSNHFTNFCFGFCLEKIRMYRGYFHNF